MAAPSLPNPLAGMALDYLIGADGPQRGKDGRVTETPFGEAPAASGRSIAYCNLRREDGEPAEFGPYLPHDDLFVQFREGRPDPKGQGFLRNIVEQLDRCRQSGHTLVEQDNPDSYPLSAVISGVDLAQQRGLGVIAKNPGLLRDDARTYVAHPNVFGIIVEKDCGTPAQMEQLRRNAGKPDLPVWFVSFGDGRAAAMQTAQQITSARLTNMGVTFSREGEYESSEDVLLPIAGRDSQFADTPQMRGMTMSDAIPSWLSTMRAITGTLEAPGSADNPVILAWRDEIAQRFPDMAAYCAEYKHDETPWCGLTVAYCMAHNGIPPVFGPTDTDKFLWAQSWKQFGTAVSTPQPGDVLVLARHVTLYDGEDGDSYLCRGGNQSDSVKVSHFPKSSVEAVRRPPTATVTDRPVGGPIKISSVPPNAGITATVFGGRDDRNQSAYDGHIITDDEFGVALPARFSGPRPKVRVSKGSKSVDCDIVDIGPWYDGSPSRPADRYWETGARPRAESDPRTNKAGIDLTPAAAHTLGVDGKGIVDWTFVTEAGVGGGPGKIPDGRVPTPLPLDQIKAAIEATLQRFKEKQMTDTTSQTTQQQGGKAVPQIDFTALAQLFNGLSQLNTTLAGMRLPSSADANAPILSPIDKALGGQAMVGLKTPLAILAGAGVWIMQAFGAVGPATATGTDKASTTAQVLYALIAAFGGLGVSSKLDRAVKALGLVASVLQKLPPPQAGGGGS